MLSGTYYAQNYAGIISRSLPVYMTGPAKTGYVGTNYTQSGNGKKYLCSVTCKIQLNKCGIRLENFTSIKYQHKKLYVTQFWKISLNVTLKYVKLHNLL